MEAASDVLQADDLPRFEANFKELLNVETIREVANFQSQLLRERQIIRERIERINTSLVQIDYNPGRYIMLEPQSGADPEIRDFLQELRTCTEGALTGSEDNQYSENKFLQVKRIIERFRGRETFSDLDRRWTRKVTDVRNWFVFSASERWREDEAEYERDALALLGKQRDATRFRDAAKAICDRFPQLVHWVTKQPISVLEHASDWPKMLALVDWTVLHTLPGVYLRQIDAPGVDTKFIERHRALLGELLDIVLPPNAIDATATGVGGFERRYGFLSKPYARSLLMDRETMLRHKEFWGKEDRPTSRDLPRLRPGEAALYDDLRFNRLGPDLRLEQERIGFRWVVEALKMEPIECD